MNIFVLLFFFRKSNVVTFPTFKPSLTPSCVSSRYPTLNPSYKPTCIPTIEPTPELQQSIIQVIDSEPAYPQGHGCTLCFPGCSKTATPLSPCNQSVRQNVIVTQPFNSLWNQGWLNLPLCVAR